jgi:hypothetical protein
MGLDLSLSFDMCKVPALPLSAELVVVDGWRTVLVVMAMGDNGQW